MKHIAYGHQNTDMTQMDWSCPKKQKARQDTIISQYHTHFSTSLPPEKQYWTICGKCAKDDGSLKQGSELHQMIDVGLIKAEQFHGVEINPDIHALNIQTNTNAHWYCDDFFSTMSQVEEFNPAIVNADFIWMPQTAAEYFARIMALVDHCTDEVMVVGNFIMRNRQYRETGDRIIEELDKCPQFHLAWDDGNWKFEDKFYEYYGTGKNITIMGTVIFVKK